MTDEAPIDLSEQEAKKIQLLEFKFQTREELLDGVKAFYATRGYALSICGSRAEKYVVLQCDRGGKYCNTQNVFLDERERTIGSRRINCPFKIKGKKGDEGFWMVEIKELSRNHVASTDISGHPSLRRLSHEDIESVDHMTQSGIPPRQILSSLSKENPDLNAVSKTVYNVKAKIHREKLGGRTVIQTLFDEMGEGGFVYDVLHDKSDDLTHLFFIHPQSITLVKSFSSIFIMDCTYKTNRYKMPLLDIVGASCLNTSFYAGFAFLKNEKVDDFVWALNMFKKILPEENQPFVIMSDRQQAFINAVNIVFPATTHLLCVWHVEKNVLTNSRGEFDSKEEFDLFLSFWNRVVYAPTETEFDQSWTELQSLYREKKATIDYIQQDLLPLKEKFVAVWTDKHLHLGNRASSRAEGAHAKLKQYLQVSTGDLQQVKDKICLAIVHEYNEIKAKLSSQKIRVLHNCNILFFKKLLSNVSFHALKEMHKQYEKVKKKRTMDPICTGNFMASTGLPCAHKMMSFADGILPLDLIHPQWRLDRVLLHALPTGSMNEQIDNEMMDLLNKFQSKYQQWPLHKKEAAKELMDKFVNNPDMIFEPEISRNKRKLPWPKKQRASSSTKRNPSKFELVEASENRKSRNNPRASGSIQMEDRSGELGITFENNAGSMFNLNDFPDF